MNSRVRVGLEAWAAAQADDLAAAGGGQKKKKTGSGGRFGLHYVDSPSAGLRYKILTCVRWCGVVVVLLLACAWCRAWFWGPFLASGHHHPPSHLLDTYKSSRRCCYPRTYHGCHRTIEQAGRRLPLTLSTYQSTNRLLDDEITTTVLSTCQLNNRLVSSQPCTYPRISKQSNHHRLEDGFPLTAAQPGNITAKGTCYSYVGVPPKKKARASSSSFCVCECVLVGRRSIDRDRSVDRRTHIHTYIYIYVQSSSPAWMDG